MEKYCVLFAMEEEAKAFISNINAKLVEEKPFKIYCSNNIYIAISNVGLINASTCFTYVNQKYDFNYYINAGLSGCVGLVLNQLDVVLVNKSYLGNVDATGFGYKLGQVPKMQEYYLSDKNLNEKLNKNFKYANICSSDVFINSQKLFDQIIFKIDKSIEIFDMECGAFFQAAYIFKKPIISLKVISDKIGSKTNEEQFRQILSKGSEIISKTLSVFLERI
ncbi:5'-methylthioadenosine/S-adenosylhomocysteine nucleosidase [Spiroplasma taiwanense]|uniref:5'-methylthioadenosine/S-adenosylhomocysteine nucleosidase n=1 Tax=Spiroplasma taiwanense CT-1 TaxID=1276220 RepID=S5MCC3_9MOLU|nr:5'-methylthioadenosine/S-adenosylhomocysteine nucleosidase [Spiroplasma taiwanense]AGR41388.1 5'-methylthioadenosine/S-adenosylhomocysteine nucleosidase [Spiroplasma taiwanense CT-1]